MINIDLKVKLKGDCTRYKKRNRLKSVRLKGQN